MQARLPKRLLILGLSCAAALALLELSLSVLGRFPDATQVVAVSLEQDGRLCIDLKGRGKERDMVRCDRMPAAGRKRIVLVGDSTIYGFHLRKHSTIDRFMTPMLEELCGAAPELINLGSPGVDVRRVELVTRFALDELSPDLVLVYTGHNEFFAPHVLPIIRAHEDPLASWVERTIGSSRTMRAWRSLGFGSRTLETRIEESPSMAGGILDRARLDPVRDQVRENYGASLRAIAASCKQAHTPLLLITPVSNGPGYAPTGSAWSAAHSTQNRQRFLACLSSAAEHLSAERLDACHAQLSQAAEIDAQVADLLHLQAELARKQGKHARARHLHLAKLDLDVSPRATPLSLRQELEQVAKDEGLPLVDLSAALERVPGPKETPYYLDAIHPTIRGQYLIARELALACIEVDSLGLHCEPGAQQRQARLPSFKKACASLGITQKTLRDTDRLIILGKLDQACVAFDPAPYLEQARSSLEKIPEQQLMKSELVLGALTLAILDGERDRIEERAAQAKSWSAVAYGRLLTRLPLLERMRSGLAEAGMDVQGGELVVLAIEGSAQH